MPEWLSVVYGMTKDLILSFFHFWKGNLVIEFEDAPPFRRFESTDGEFSHQHYAIRVHNADPLNRPRDGLKVNLTKLQRTQHRFNLPIELRYRDRSVQRHHLNPNETIFVDVLSFEISVKEDRMGFFINFHGDNDTDYSMPCENCRIQIEASTSVDKPVRKAFEIGLGTVEESSHRKSVFFMREAD
jgi:hypothetical protein